MEIYRVSKTNSGTVRKSSIISNGPIASLISLVVSFLALFLFLVIGGFELYSTISNSKYEDYKTIATVSEVKNGVLDGDEVTTYILKYEINGTEYTIEEDSSFFGEHEIGYTISANYDPDTMQIVFYGNSGSNRMVLIVNLIAIVICVFSVIKNFNNFMHFFKPDKYSLINDNESELNNLESQKDYDRSGYINDGNTHIKF